MRLVRVLQNENGINEIYGFARKEITPVLLHAAAFEPAIKRIALIDPLWSFSSLVMNRYYKSSFIPGTVPGSLKAYDLPDLMAALAPGKLLIAGLLDGNGNYADNEAITEDITFIKKAYQLKNSEDQLRVITGDISGKLYDLFLEWIK